MQIQNALKSCAKFVQFFGIAWVRVLLALAEEEWDRLEHEISEFQKWNGFFETTWKTVHFCPEKVSLLSSTTSSLTKSVTGWAWIIFKLEEYYQLRRTNYKPNRTQSVSFRGSSAPARRMPASRLSRGVLSLRILASTSRHAS
jgi:hypothetical protein